MSTATTTSTKLANGHGSTQGTFFVESPLILSILSSLSPSSPPFTLPSSGKVLPTVSSKVEYVTDTFDKYLEQPHLLDQHLDEIMEVLVRGCLDVILPLFGGEESGGGDVDGGGGGVDDEKFDTLHPRLKIIYSLSKVRGYKTIRQLFSHSVSHLEPVLAALVYMDKDLPSGWMDGESGGSVDHRTGFWESRYSLLLWLSFLSLVPFDISTIDSTITAGAAVAATSTTSTTATTATTTTSPPPLTSLTTTLLTLSKSYLRSSTPAGLSAAPVLLSSILTRPDMLPDDLDDLRRGKKKGGKGGKSEHAREFLEFAKGVLRRRVECMMRVGTRGLAGGGEGGRGGEEARRATLRTTLSRRFRL